MKYKLLKDLYDCFYTPPELPTQKQEIEECHQALSEVLGKTERRLVLQIIDAKDRIAEDTSRVIVDGMHLLHASGHAGPKSYRSSWEGPALSFFGAGGVS